VVPTWVFYNCSVSGAKNLVVTDIVSVYYTESELQWEGVSHKVCFTFKLTTYSEL